MTLLCHLIRKVSAKASRAALDLRPARLALMEKEMDENVQHDLVLECRRLAQQLSEGDESPGINVRSKRAKEKREALQGLLSLDDQHPLSFDDLTGFLCDIYENSLLQSTSRWLVVQVLLAWAHRRNLPFHDAVQAAHALYCISPKGSEEKQQAVEALLTQARWPDISMRQSLEAVKALCYASPLRSKWRVQGILVSFELAQRPHLSAEDALAFITLDSDHMCIIGSTSALLEKRELAVRKKMLQALVQRPELTSEQAEIIAEALTVP